MKPFPFIAVAAFAIAAPAYAQTAQDEARMAEQREAMAPLLERMAGHWRGTAETRGPGGSMVLTQTERVGPMLDGTIAVVEGRGHAGDGSLPFHAFAVISYDTDKDEHRIRSWANGRGGDFPLWPTETGFRWEVPAGPATIRYVATVDGRTWREVGTYEREGMEPMVFIEMNLERIDDSEWPEAGAVGPD